MRNIDYLWLIAAFMTFSVIGTLILCCIESLIERDLVDKCGQICNGKIEKYDRNPICIMNNTVYEMMILDDNCYFRGMKE